MDDFYVYRNSEDMSSLTDTQDKVLSILPIFPSLLSIWGSTNIIHMVWVSEKKTPYRRILLGLSVCDLINSLVFPFQPFLLPNETSERIWAIGNEQTCDALGFFQQFHFTSVWYNGMLSFYFLLSVRYGVKEDVMARRYEPVMHLLSIGYPLVTALFGAGFHMYNEVLVGHGCWIYNFPSGCVACDQIDPLEGETCCLSPTMAWLFAGIPTFLTFVAILVNNFLVYMHVRKTILKSNRYLERMALGQSDDLSLGAASGHSTVSSRPSNASHNPRQIKRIKAVATQAFLYVVAFLLTYVPALSLRIMESGDYDAEDEYELFPMLIWQALFLPLQGFFNCLIFARPSYMRVRKQHPEEGRFWAFRRALHGDKVEPKTEESKQANQRSAKESSTHSYGGAIAASIRASYVTMTTWGDSNSRMGDSSRLHSSRLLASDANLFSSTTAGPPDVEASPHVQACRRESLRGGMKLEDLFEEEEEDISSSNFFINVPQSAAMRASGKSQLAEEQIEAVKEEEERDSQSGVDDDSTSWGCNATIGIAKTASQPDEEPCNREANAKEDAQASPHPSQHEHLEAQCDLQPLQLQEETRSAGGGDFISATSDDAGSEDSNRGDKERDKECRAPAQEEQEEKGPQQPNVSSLADQTELAEGFTNERSHASAQYHHLSIDDKQATESNVARECSCSPLEAEEEERIPKEQDSHSSSVAGHDEESQASTAGNNMLHPPLSEACKQTAALDDNPSEQQGPQPDAGNGDSQELESSKRNDLLEGLKTKELDDDQPLLRLPEDKA